MNWISSLISIIVITMIIVVVGSEGGSRLLFYLDQKNVISHNIFKSEVFSIRDFTEKVDDFHTHLIHTKIEGMDLRMDLLSLLFPLQIFFV